MRPSTVIISSVSIAAALCAAVLPAEDWPYSQTAPAASALPQIIGAAPAAPYVPSVPASELPAVTPAGPVASPAPAQVRQAGTACDPAALHHCSVVGAVQYPGTYAGEHPSVMLSTLIEQAGGLTAEAAGTVRILHAGREATVDIGPKIAPIIVSRESVVVVDSTVAGPRPAIGGADAYIDVACVQLLGRPVVLWLAPQNATVSRVLGLLGQRPEVAATVHVVGPRDSHGFPEGTLASGAVLVFDPQALDQRALADALARSPLQDLVIVEPPDVQQTAAETVELFQFLESRMQPADDVTITSNELTAQESSPAAPLILQAEAPQPPAPRDSPPTLPTTPAALAAPDAVELSDTGTPKDENVLPASAVQLRSVAKPQSVRVEEFDDLDPEVVKAMDEAASRHQAADEVLPMTAEDANSQWLQFIGSFMVWVVCGIALYGVYAFWMRQLRRRRSAKPAPSVIEELRTEVETPVPARSTLSQLIDNSLPVREEEAPAATQALHGRTVGFRYLIRSGPHPIQGPHFATVREQSPAREAVSMAAEPPSRSTSERPVTASTGRTDQTFNRIDAPVEAKATEPPPSPPTSSPRGVSPLERALRSLLREGQDSAP